jgi:hypothetical protein
MHNLKEQLPRIFTPLSSPECASPHTPRLNFLKPKVAPKNLINLQPFVYFLRVDAKMEFAFSASRLLILGLPKSRLTDGCAKAIYENREI